jgi:hypothetical protein
MGRESTWTIQNLTPETRHTSLVIGARAADAPRVVTLALDGVASGQIEVGTDEHDVELPALVLTPGAHTLILTAVGALTSPAATHGSTDTRELSVMLTSASWTDLGTVARAR